MAKETVQAVRLAEQNAAQLEKESIIKKETIIAEAHQNSKDLISSMTKEASDKANHDLNVAQKKSVEMLEASKVEAEKEVLILKEMVKRKEKEAIDLVISNIIYDD